MKKELFKRQLGIIMTYMPDRQIIKILGQNDRYQIDPKTGIIIDVMSQQQDPETGEISFTRQANIRDVRSLEYNVIAEQAPGNLSKRMTELQVLLEMQERLPVPPEQLISKLEISASEKEIWLEYIKSQEAAQQQQQEEMKDDEFKFKDREIKVDEEKNKMDFMVDLAKIKQMSEKDEKAMMTKYAQMDKDEQSAVREFALQILQADQQAQIDARKAGQEIQIDAVKAGQELKWDERDASQDLSQDARKHSQDLNQDGSKHDQNMKFTKEKFDIALDYARKKAAEELKIAKEKGAQDLKMAKQKAKEGGSTDGKGKQSTDAKN